MGKKKNSSNFNGNKNSMFDYKQTNQDNELYFVLLIRNPNNIGIQIILQAGRIQRIGFKFQKEKPNAIFSHSKERYRTLFQRSELANSS
ncbi:UNKNOWN [Stylonychia lemnae]|uniref:Uncharacterized protein n=1 Tax=Stylonychia lemnae TaxID=5949 RepID=A0A078B7B9_STYLE|nr:UNKNOWN [Stylonychia lemnae]|eukprot:CDW89458.1 UNKNOWN [Stylonychia lemnae]